MKKRKTLARLSLLLALLLFPFYSSFAQNDYFFPAGQSFDPAIPTPEQFLGYPVGAFHTRYDRVTAYLEALAGASGKAHFQVIGYTNEHRPQVVLTITSQANYRRLESIREAHRQLCRPEEAMPEVGNLPVVVLLGYNVHGNEPSSTEAAMLTAYYLVASQNPETQRFLDEAVVFVDPAFNPDGRDRHSTWANMHRGQPLVADPLDREHNEVWPGGRTNHYWFDLNRDWLPLAQVESRNRLAFYHQWLPNVVTDYHEMGTNSTYFFEPTKPFGSENPIVPRRNYEELNGIFANYFQRVLDEIGSLYFTKEVYDNSYPGYGSTYPDIHGGLGMVFEQASSRGHLQKTTTEDITFAFTIRNHVRTGIATVRASVENRELLLRYQREFFANALRDGRRSRIKAYVFGDANDGGRTRAFADLLLRHRIETYQLDRDVTAGGKTYSRGKAFVVPADQAQYLMVRTMFEPVTSFYDSVFYDASAWTMALAYGMPYSAVEGPVAKGAALTAADLAYTPAPAARGAYGYLFEWSEYYAPRALHYLLEKGVYAKAAFKPFAASVDSRKQSFGYGSIFISAADQKVSPDELHRLINEAARTAGIDIFPVATGLSLEGVDLGSRWFQTVKRPRAVMLVGEGTAGYEAGEVWHLLDTRVGMPITKIDLDDFGRLNLHDYHSLVMVSGAYRQLGEKEVQKIKSWAEAGGTLILLRTAVDWAVKNKLVGEALLKEEKKDSIPPRSDWGGAPEREGARRIGGSVYLTDLDITHPLGFGYRDRALAVYRNHEVFLQPSKNAYSTVIKYADRPQLDGYAHPDNLKKIARSASAVVSRLGAGRAILLCDNPNFRGFWYGTNRLFLNALFLGEHITAPGGG